MFIDLSMYLKIWYHLKLETEYVVLQPNSRTVRFPVVNEVSAFIGNPEELVRVEYVQIDLERLDTPFGSVWARYSEKLDVLCYSEIDK